MANLMRREKERKRSQARYLGTNSKNPNWRVKGGVIRKKQ